jgi:hypothetical protein
MSNGKMVKLMNERYELGRQLRNLEMSLRERPEDIVLASRV